MYLEEPNNLSLCKYFFLAIYSVHVLLSKVNFLLLVLICLSVCALSHGKVVFGS